MEGNKFCKNKRSKENNQGDIQENNQGDNQDNKEKIDKKIELFPLCGRPMIVNAKSQKAISEISHYKFIKTGKHVEKSEIKEQINNLSGIDVKERTVNTYMKKNMGLSYNKLITRKPENEITGDDLNRINRFYADLYGLLKEYNNCPIVTLDETRFCFEELKIKGWAPSSENGKVVDTLDTGETVIFLVSNCIYNKNNDGEIDKTNKTIYGFSTILEHTTSKSIIQIYKITNDEDSIKKESINENCEFNCENLEYIKDGPRVNYVKGVNNEIFYNVCDCITHWKNEIFGKDEHIILLMDNLNSHKYPDTILELESNKIHISFLPPYKAMFFSPLDRLIFGVFKNGLRKDKKDFIEFKKGKSKKEIKEQAFKLLNKNLETLSRSAILKAYADCKLPVDNITDSPTPKVKAIAGNDEIILETAENYNISIPIDSRVKKRKIKPMAHYKEYIDSNIEFDEDTLKYINEKKEDIDKTVVESKKRRRTSRLLSSILVENSLDNENDYNPVYKIKTEEIEKYLSDKREKEIDKIHYSLSTILMKPIPRSIGISNDVRNNLIRLNEIKNLSNNEINYHLNNNMNTFVSSNTNYEQKRSLISNEVKNVEYFKSSSELLIKLNINNNDYYDLMNFQSLIIKKFSILDTINLNDFIIEPSGMMRGSNLNKFIKFIEDYVCENQEYILFNTLFSLGLSNLHNNKNQIYDEVITETTSSLIDPYTNKVINNKTLPVLIPLNINIVRSVPHWVCIIIIPKNKEIQVYDSLPGYLGHELNNSLNKIQEWIHMVYDNKESNTNNPQTNIEDSNFKLNFMEWPNQKSTYCGWYTLLAIYLKKPLKINNSHNIDNLDCWIKELISQLIKINNEKTIENQNSSFESSNIYFSNDNHIKLTLKNSNESNRNHLNSTNSNLIKSNSNSNNIKLTFHSSNESKMNQYLSVMNFNNNKRSNPFNYEKESKIRRIF